MLKNYQRFTFAQLQALVLWMGSLLGRAWQPPVFIIDRDKQLQELVLWMGSLPAREHTPPGSTPRPGAHPAREHSFTLSVQTIGCL